MARMFGIQNQTNSDDINATLAYWILRKCAQLVINIMNWTWVMHKITIWKELHREVKQFWPLNKVFFCNKLSTNMSACFAPSWTYTKIILSTNFFSICCGLSMAFQLFFCRITQKKSWLSKFVEFDIYLCSHTKFTTWHGACGCEWPLLSLTPLAKGW